MLPYIVLAMAVVYLILQYSGVFKDSGRQGPRRDDHSQDRPPPLEGEAERRLQVFEDFLKSKESPPDDEE